MSNLLTLSLLNIGSTRLNIHETSICLLRAINKYYLQDDLINYQSSSFASKNQASSGLKESAKLDKDEVPASKTSTLSSISSHKSDSLKSGQKTTAKETKPSGKTNLSPVLLEMIDYDIINSMVIYSKSQMFISEYLARKNPEKTMFIFCELTSRLEQCSSHQLRQTMLNVLVPWLYNVELVDPNVVQTLQTPTALNLSYVGSQESTEIILNNLFYLTCKFADQHGAEFELIWAILASTFSANLKIIVRYVFIMISLASYDMIKYGKHVICYLAKSCPERVSDELITELEFMDSLSSCLDKWENSLPFYR
jgi:hypothetical protein